MSTPSRLCSQCASPLAPYETLSCNIARAHRSKAWIGILGPLVLLVLLVGCGGPNPVSVPTPTPTFPVPSLSLTTFNLHLPAAALNAPVVGPLPDNTLLHVSVTFKVNQQLLNQLGSKKVPQGQTQNLENLANQLGITDSQYQQIKAYFGVQDANLNLNKLHTTLTIDAKAKTFAQLLQVQFVQHKLNGRTFYIPTSNPKVPTAIANSILAINGLDSYSFPPRTGAMARHFNGKSWGSRKRPTADCNPSQNTLNWTNVAHLYGYDQLHQAGLHGEGITINLIEIDGFDQADVQNYADCVHYQGQRKVVDLNTPPTPQGESTLDIEMIMGLAPAANIVDYESSDSSFVSINDELQHLINDNTNNTGSGSIVSISLGGPEAGLDQGDIAAIDQSLKILNQAEHMTVFVASGDCAAFDIGDFAPASYGILAVNFPASDPWAVAVGGTAPVLDQSTNTIHQIAWSDGSNRLACHNAWGSGGGLSQTFPHPDWQVGTGVQNKYSNGKRQIPDVSAFAFALADYYQGAWTGIAGTSAAAPIWASGMALVNEGLIQQTQHFFYGPGTFYQVARNGASTNSQPYSDVTQGDNLYYPATPGWDFATGLGTPNLPDFYKVLLAMAKQS